MSSRLSETAIWSVVEDPTTSRATTIDIGAQTNNSAYVGMKSFARAMLQVELGTFNGTDTLDECRLEQAVDSSGTSVKELTTDDTVANNGNYDTGNKIGSDGDIVVIEIRGEDLDVDAATPFDFIRALVKEDDDTAQDDCFALLIRYGASYMRKELQGVAATGTRQYVDVNVNAA